MPLAAAAAAATPGQIMVVGTKDSKDLFVSVHAAHCLLCAGLVAARERVVGAGLLANVAMCQCGNVPMWQLHCRVQRAAPLPGIWHATHVIHLLCKGSQVHPNPSPFPFQPTPPSGRRRARASGCAAMRGAPPWHLALSCPWWQRWPWAARACGQPRTRRQTGPRPSTW